LSRDELSIVLAPGRVALLRAERALTLRGYQRRIGAREMIACESEAAAAAEFPESGEMPWSRAIASLEAALPAIAQSRMDVNVILSNHFMHYALVPWFDDLTDEEELALARHCFDEMFGGAAESLSVRVSPGRAGVAALASAVDTRLLEDLRALLDRTNLELKSIQPHLMVAYNSCRDRLAGCNAWVALMERRSLCLAALQGGELAWVRKLRIGDDWQQELPSILEREAYLAATEVNMDEVLLWAPHLADTEIPAGWRWKFRPMKPSRKAGLGREFAGLCALEAKL
jgi:hypothetical protein